MAYNAEEFAALLKKSWDVNYCQFKWDREKLQGSIDLAHMGLTWWEHGSDPAVCVQINLKRRVKGSAEDMHELIEQISELISNTD